MIERILVAIDDSPPALTAAGFGVELARLLGAELHLTTVAEEGRDPDVILRHVTALADDAAVPSVATVVPDGREPFEALLEAAERCRADLIVLGRSNRRTTGRPYVGSQTEHVLEFADIPVVVVPETSQVHP